MKKTFALVLAVAMVMSLAAVSFAATTTTVNNLAFETDSAFRYKSDDKAMANDTLAYGDTVYYLLRNESVVTVTDGDDVDETTTLSPISDYAAVEKLKIKAKWEMGGDLVESVSIVKKYIDATSSANKASFVEASGYYYFVAIKVASKETTSDADIVGTLTLNRKEVKDGNTVKYAKVDDQEENISFNVFYRNTWLNDVDYTSAIVKVITDDVQLDWDTAYALKFDADDDVEISFGRDPNEGTFTVDASGQGKLYVKYNTNANEAIANANPNANLKFVNFNNVKFNRTGEFMYEYEDGAYAYQIVDGKLVAIPSLKYDDADEAFYFNTRVLGSYVFSDVELVDAVVDAPVVTAPVETNPSTGAAA